MSTVANAALSAPGPILINSQSIPNSADKVEENAPKVIAAKVSDSESDSDSETSTEDEDTSDDERMADNPILKERLKQLDRYATPLSHKTQSPDQAALSGAYATPLPLTDCMVNSAPLSSHGKSSGPSDVVDSSSTPSEYRSHQPSVTESPNPCSGPASVTPKHNFSPPYGIHGGASGPSSQHDQHSSATFYSHLSSKFSRKSNDGPACGYRNSFPEGCETGVPDNQIGVGEGGQEFICDVCNAVYANVASLRSHMKKHNYIAKRHQCEHCPYSTQYGKNLLKHIESMHEKGQTDQFQCEGCARFFPTEDHLRDHECASLQFNAYRCEECGRVFKTKLRLKYHADIHNPRKPYVCDVEGCDRAFRTPKYLKNHRDEFHRMQPKNYLCPVEGCDLVFHRKTHLKRHIATHEDSEKKYHCQWPSCQRRFCSEETLNLHYRKHTGEKPFNCALCTYTCYNKPTLNEHYRLNHAKDSTVEGPYKSFNPPTSSPSCGAQHTSANTYDFGSRKDEESSNVRSSTPAALPTVRHRMADILESCGTQPPGPLDAEINGILDSLDKESDLPDLFTSSNFDFESTAPDATYRNGSHATGPNPPPAAYEHPTISSSSHETRYPSTLSPAVSGDQPRVISSLEATLAGILADFQKADLNNSIEAFEEAKSRALSVLPTFTTGNTLDQQLTAILENVLESFVGQPPQVLRAVFQAAHSFTREECYMIESLEHQLMDDSPLIAPTPPRRRGRRPKLQQQLQPFLQRVFDLEPGTAEAMAAHLVTSAQQERNVSFCHQFSATECIRGRGRGRGYRIRGRPGRPLSLTLKLFPDGTASRTQHELIGYRRVAGGSVLRGSGISRRMRGGVRGRYKIDRLSGTPGNRFQHSSPMGENSREARSPVDNLPEEPHSSHPEHQRSFDEPHGFDMEDQELGYIQHPHGDRFDSDTPVQSEEIDATSMRLREIRKLSGESDEELDDLDDTDEGVDDEAGEAYEEKDLSQHAQTDQPDTAVRRSTALDVAELSKVVSQKSSLYNTSDKGSVNQDTLGEMLEDLGVIVKRIGERAAARRQPCAQESPPIYPTQPLNLAELPEDEQPADCSVASLLLNGSKLTRNRTDSSAPAIQLPSMAILASASVGTPTSVGEGSTPGCSANVEPQEASPHFSATHSQQPTPTAGPYGPVQSHTPVMSAPSDNQTASSCTGTHPTVLSCTPLRGEFKASQSDYHHRSVPMWSCESMCCPTTRENCSVGPDKSAYSRSPSYDGGSVHRMSVPCSVEDSADTGQSYHPTDLSTRMVVGGYDSQSIPSPQASPSSPKHQQPGSVNPVCGVDTNGMVNKSGLLPPYPGSVSSTTTAMDSLRSAVEAVDHLRSLSALGAKYTASLGMSDDPAQSQSYHHSLRLPVCPYTSRSTQQDESPQPGSVGRPDPGPSPTPPPHGSVHSSGPNIFTPPHIPSALNNLLSRDQKNETMINSPLGLSTGGANGHCVSPSKGDFPVQTAPGSGSALCGYSPYHPSSISSRCSSRGRNENSFHSLGLPGPTSACSSASSSSSSARSYLQDVYQQHQQQQRELQYHHHHQQQQQQQQQQQHHQHHQQSHVPNPTGFSHHSTKSPVHELTTRQLLSEAAATAYAHGLGRCDTQSFMSGNNQGHTLDITSPRGNAYTHPSGPGFANPYNRYSTAPEATSYGHAHSEQSSTEHGFHAAHLSGADFGSPSSSHGVTSTARSISGSIGHNTGAHYMGGHGVGLSDPYQLYSPHLRQSSSHMHPALSRSVDQHQSSQLAQPTHVQPQSAVAAAHLAHSIHEVSGLAAAYHAYHQYHQQQQAGRHGLGVPVPTSPVPTPGAHAHYHNLLNAQSRAYYPPPSGLDDQFSTHRDLGLYTTHSERRDPKSAYLAETYRESQATSGRFLF